MWYILLLYYCMLKKRSKYSILVCGTSRHVQNYAGIVKTNKYK